MSLQSAHEKEQMIEELKSALEQCKAESNDDKSPVEFLLFQLSSSQTHMHTQSFKCHFHFMT